MKQPQNFFDLYNDRRLHKFGKMPIFVGKETTAEKIDRWITKQVNEFKQWLKQNCPGK